VTAATARGDGEEDSQLGNARLAGLGYSWTVEFGNRAAMAAGRLSARPRGGRGILNRAWARPAVMEG
jgi:hypothetical protein